MTNVNPTVNPSGETVMPGIRQPIYFDLASTHRHLGGEEEDYRPTRRARAAYNGEAPAPWSPVSTVASIVGIVIGFILVLGAILLLTNSGPFCDSACMLAKKDMAIAHETTLRAMANSSANAQAGFGNNDDTTRQAAVAPPARIEYRYAPPAPAAAPAASAPASTGPAAGIASPAPEWGRCWKDKVVSDATHWFIGSDGKCYGTPHGTPADPRPHS